MFSWCAHHPHIHLSRKLFASIVIKIHTPLASGDDEMRGAEDEPSAHHPSLPGLPPIPPHSIRRPFYVRNQTEWHVSQRSLMRVDNTGRGPYTCNEALPSPPSVCRHISRPPSHLIIPSSPLIADEPGRKKDMHPDRRTNTDIYVRLYTGTA